MKKHQEVVELTSLIDATAKNDDVDQSSPVGPIDNEVDYPNVHITRHSVTVAVTLPAMYCYSYYHSSLVYL